MNRALFPPPKARSGVPQGHRKERSAQSTGSAARRGVPAVPDVSGYVRRCLYQDEPTIR